MIDKVVLSMEKGAMAEDWHDRPACYHQEGDTWRQNFDHKKGRRLGSRECHSSRVEEDVLRDAEQDVVLVADNAVAAENESEESLKSVPFPWEAVE